MNYMTIQCNRVSDQKWEDQIKMTTKLTKVYEGLHMLSKSPRQINNI